MRTTIISAIAVLLFITTSPATASGKIFNVRDFGAKGDGKTIDTPAINAAIEEASRNGGEVFFPAGTYACYSIHLASHVTLNIDKSAVILAAKPTDTEGYDLAENFEYGHEYQDYGHSHFKNSLIWGIDIEDVTICGEGLIDGSGLVPAYGDDPLTQPAPLRGNKGLSLKNCKDITVQDITMYNCGHFAILATGVEDMYLLGITVDTQRDGFDIDCCRNVDVVGCRLNCPWDDGICLKASYALGHFKDTENVTVTGCTVMGYKEGTMLDGRKLMPYDKQGHSWSPDRSQRPPFKVIGRGRVKFGTESSGGFRNIKVSNCYLESCGGIFLETVDGGILDNVTFDNITLNGTNSPLFFRLGARMRSPEGTPVGALRNVTIKNMKVTDADPRFPIIISGIPGYKVENILLKDISIEFQGGLTPDDVQKPSEVPELIEKYPEYKMFGPLPAKGAYLRHVNGIKVEGLHLTYMKPDTRPLFVMDDVESAQFCDITVDGKEVTAEISE